jgi:hypothetical protein
MEIIKQSETQTINYKGTPIKKLKTMDDYNDKKDGNVKSGVGKDGKKKKEGGCKCVIY